MDTTYRALRKVQEDVVASRAWSRLHRELLTQMAHSAGGQLRMLGSLSPGDKLGAVERAVEALGETSAYAWLQAEVATAVDQHFSPLLFQPSRITQELSATSVDSCATVPRALAADPLAEACSVMLRGSPHLKHSLKYILNHPLPHGLRLSAWRALLHRPNVQKDFLVASKELQPGDETGKEIARRCREVLGGNPAFRGLAGSGVALSAMQAVTLYWKQRTSGEEVLDSELLLCVPFVHVWREELERQSSSGADWSWSKGLRALFAEIAAEYVQFMEMLPPSVSSSATQSADGMNKFAGRVEELLESEDPQLHRALVKAFKRTGGRSQRGRERGNSFHHTLKSILFPHIQKMLVGDVSMDVVCYIWDQCFIGLEVPEYQCLPYFTTVWLLLLRDKLLRATSVDAVEKVLVQHSHSLTILQFQREMEKTFLSDLSRPLKVKPLPLHPSHSSPLLPSLHPSRHPQSRPHPSHHPQSYPPPPSHTTHSLFKTQRKKRRDLLSTTGGRAENDLQQKMEEMQQKVEKEQRILSHRIREEREQHQIQLEIFRQDLEELKMGLGGRERRSRRSVAIGQSQLLHPSLQSPVVHSHSSTSSHQPTLLLVGPTSSSKLDPTASKVQEMRVIPVQITSQQTLGSGSEGSPTLGGDSSERPFSPTHLSERDMQSLWLQILGRFTSAAYTICHGTESERRVLLQSTISADATQ